MYITPEQGGIPSLAIKDYLEALENAGLSTHNIIIAKGNDILFEKYYAPFHKDFLHREYSDTKSYVGIACGFATQDGLIDLDDPIGKYFPEECTDMRDPQIAEQTIRQMLKMSTPKKHIGWFSQRSADRVLDYFRKTGVAAPLGSRFDYDSQGSFILGAMIERLTGMTFLDYLRTKFLDRIGFSKEARCLKAPGGHSWGDSALLAKATDQMKVIRFLLDKGKIDGEQVLNEQFVTEACGNLISTEREPCKFDAQGYGYQIWRTYEESILFNGMGGQFAVGVPGRDLIFIINSDNQGIDKAGATVIDKFFELVASRAGEPLPDDPEAKAELDAYADSLVLACEHGNAHSPLEKAIDGGVYTLGENPMEIKYVRFVFASDRTILEYENAQGKKTLPIGLCENCFTLFPEEGYSREVGSAYAPGNYYKCAVSGAWKSESRFVVNAQVIDEYFGRLWMTFDFEGDSVKVDMRKTAEDFYTTYQGSAEGNC